MVGSISLVKLLKSETRAEVIRAGHSMTPGTRTPPSYSQPFPDRSGRLLVGPVSRRVVQRPPLSEKKKTTVLSVKLSSSNLPSRRPTLSSTAAIIDA